MAASCIIHSLFSDWATFKWKLPPALYFLVDVILLSGVLLANTIIILLMAELWHFGSDWPMKHIFIFLLSVALVVVAGAFALFLAVVAVMNVFGSQGVDHPNPEPTGKTFRLNIDRSALVEECKKFIFRHAIFRKHSYVCSLLSVIHTLI